MAGARELCENETSGLQSEEAEMLATAVERWREYVKKNQNTGSSCTGIGLPEDDLWTAAAKWCACAHFQLRSRESAKV